MLQTRNMCEVIKYSLTYYKQMLIGALVHQHAVSSLKHEREALKMSHAT